MARGRIAGYMQISDNYVRPHGGSDEQRLSELVI